MIRLSNFFSDRMVLQRETDKNTVWGYGEGEIRVSLIKEDASLEKVFEEKTAAGADGYFEVKLPAFGAGGNYTLKICDSTETAEIKDVTFGDVFVCGGQSNMELPINRTMERYAEEIKTVNDTDIRFFKVVEKFNFHHTEELIENGSWYYAKLPELLDFGALAFFTASEIKNREGVPIGIYNTAIGGTPVKSWCSEATMRRLGLHVKEYEECGNDEWVQNTIKTEAEADMAWREEADKAYSEDMSGNLSGTFEVPGFFEGTPLGAKNMAVYFKKEFTLPAGWSDEDTKLYLGAIIDSDKVYVNGTFVGETGYLYPPRIYKVPKGVLKEGKNIIEIRLLVFRGEGGFMPGKDYMIKRPDGETVSLAGEWEYTVAKEMPFCPNLTFFSYKATGVYNCMIYPLRKQQCRGFFFYQGESNVDDYATYKDEFEAVIEDWRELWGDKNLPFMFVQIAAFNDGNRHGYWGRRSLFTEEQRKCTELPRVAMIQAYDLGEYNDLHPTNKKELGRRAALAAEDLVYGKGTYIPGPEKQSVVFSAADDDTEAAEITFADDIKLILSHGIGVTTDETRNEKDVKGFCYWKDDKSYEAAAEITEANKVVVSYPKDADAISYAWSDSPLEANLYSEDRLPVVPFYIKLK